MDCRGLTTCWLVTDCDNVNLWAHSDQQWMRFCWREVLIVLIFISQTEKSSYIGEHPSCLCFTWCDIFRHNRLDTLNWILSLSRLRWEYLEDGHINQWNTSTMIRPSAKESSYDYDRVVYNTDTENLIVDSKHDLDLDSEKQILPTGGSPSSHVPL